MPFDKVRRAFAFSQGARSPPWPALLCGTEGDAGIDVIPLVSENRLSDVLLPRFHQRHDYHQKSSILSIC